MKYHKKLSREEVLKYGWRKILLMAASEFSRAASLSGDGKGKEVENCFFRAKELLGVMETDSSIPSQTGLKLLLMIKKMINNNLDFKGLYNKSTLLATS